MKTLTDIEFLKLNKFQKFWYKFVRFFIGIPFAIWGGIKFIGRFFKKIGLGIWHEIKDIALTFVHGDWKTKISYFIMGFGNLTRRQILRGLMFFGIEAAFIVYMIFVGAPALAKLGTLGTVSTGTTQVCKMVM